jgi:hypothetical protein
VIRPAKCLASPLAKRQAAQRSCRLKVQRRVVNLADALEEVAPGAPDDENVFAARNSAVEALEALRAELISALPSERVKHLRLTW